MAEQEKKLCPNCGKKDTMFGKITFLSQKEIDFINKFHEPKHWAYCDGENCGGMLLSTYKRELKSKKNALKAALDETDFGGIPVITLPNPQGWNYEIIGMVNAQTTTGTGAITEIFAQVADFMGEQSERHNNKLQAAIESCKNQLRMQTLSQGGNAVIGCDVDITTAGVGNGLIMVCMSGTSIFINDVSIFSDEVQSNLEKLIQLHNEISDLSV